MSTIGHAACKPSVLLARERTGLDAMTSTELSSVAIVPVTLVDGRVKAGADGVTWRTAIDHGKIVIFRGAFSAASMVSLRRDLQAWASRASPLPLGISASRRGLDFHRVDDGTTFSHLPHVFHQFGVATGAALPDGLATRIRALRHALLDWQNRLAGTDFDLDASEFRFKAIRHPRGGGHLVPHRHPYEPQRVSIFLNLSDPGVDYRSGAARFRNASGWLDTHADFRSGDMLAWRYDLVHDVSPVERNVPQKWEGDDGLWIAAVEWVDAHPNSTEA